MTNIAAQAQYSFQGIAAEQQQLVLRARKGVGKLLGVTGGFAGRILRFEAGTTQACAKLPIAKSNPAHEMAKRFLRELRLQRGLHYHQFVHWPFDFDLVHDTPVAWFRFWHCDLAALIEEPAFTLEGRLALLAYLASALAHCHERGLIAHQDLKPENVFVQDLSLMAPGLPAADVWRIPKLADFGSANLANECGEYRGTKAYMAPEQWDRTPLGRHTSVWSLGLIAHELLTFGLHPVGQPTRPWRNGEKPVFNRWQKDRMWLRWMEGGCRPASPVGDPALDATIGRCLDVDPGTRPSIEEFTAAMLAALRDRSPRDAEQAAFRIFHADRESESDHSWPYLDHRFDALVRATAERFDDPSILAHLLSRIEPEAGG